MSSFEHAVKYRATVAMHRKVRNTFSIFIPESQDGKGKANIFANAIKHDFKSKNPTTRWSDIIKLK